MSKFIGWIMPKNSSYSWIHRSFFEAISTIFSTFALVFLEIFICYTSQSMSKEIGWILPKYSSYSWMHWFKIAQCSSLRHETCVLLTSFDIIFHNLKSQNLTLKWSWSLGQTKQLYNCKIVRTELWKKVVKFWEAKINKYGSNEGNAFYYLSSLLNSFLHSRALTVSVSRPQGRRFDSSSSPAPPSLSPTPK